MTSVAGTAVAGSQPQLCTTCSRPLGVVLVATVTEASVVQPPTGDGSQPAGEGGRELLVRDRPDDGDPPRADLAGGHGGPATQVRVRVGGQRLGTVERRGPRPPWSPTPASGSPSTLTGSARVDVSSYQVPAAALSRAGARSARARPSSSP